MTALLETGGRLRAPILRRRATVVRSSKEASRRWLDLVLALLLLVPLCVVMAVVAVAILVVDGRPVFYRSERMRDLRHGFWLWKFRTMRPATADHGATSAHKFARITRLGRFLRRTRLDELPQIFNILRGDIGFVGPRPPLREYVERYPSVFAAVLADRPGVTGLASLVYHRREEQLLAGCATAAAAEAIYCRRCIPDKARLDILYARRRTAARDLAIILRTVATVWLGRPGTRPAQDGAARKAGVPA